MLIEAELLMTLDVELKAPIVTVGKTDRGFLRLIPITGGTFSGDKLRGRVVPGGYDWNLQVDGERTRVHARYALMTDDGAAISVDNEGWLDARCPDRAVITTPRLEAAAGKYDFLNGRVFLGSLEPGEAGDSVRLTFYGLADRFRD
jgi:hypothetical protein